jgi:rubrerythrin
MNLPTDPSKKETNALRLMDGIRIAKENERTAADYYAEAAKSAGPSKAKKLFEQLTQFERIHYEKLTALEESIKAKGGFINYAGTEFVIPPNLVIKMSELPNPASIMNIIAAAVDLETRAEKAYNELAGLTTDPQGYDMFRKLAEEEHKHYRILKDVYWTLTNLGEWNGPVP